MRWEAACLPSSLPVICAGIGAQRAALAAHALLDRGACSLISFGSAAGLDPTVNSGALFVTSHTVVLAAIDQHADGEPGRKQQFSAPMLHDDWALCAQIRQQLQRLEPRDGLIVQCPTVVHTVAQKHALHLNSGAQLTDMESAVIAQVAAERGVPFVAIRVVLDDANTALPQPLVAASDKFGQVMPWLMMRTLAARPRLFTALPNLALAQYRAKRTLVAAAELLAPYVKLDIER